MNINVDAELQNVKSVAISGHVRPDGDCVGSTLATYNYITKYHPDIKCDLFLEPIPDVFKFLHNADKIQSIPNEDREYDLFIALDCGDLNRLGDAAKYFTSAKRTFCVDHHMSNTDFATHSYVIPDASSTCELVFNLMVEQKITKEIAECLYVGLVHDTGVFQFSCTKDSTMEVGGKLMNKGIDYPEIVRATYYEKTYEQNRVLGYCLLNSKMYSNGRVLASVLTKKEQEEFNVTSKDLDGVVNQLRNTKGVEVAIFIYEVNEGDYKASTRANGGVNLVDVASVWGGGGHVRASGFSFTGDIDSTLLEIVAEIEKQL